MALLPLFDSMQHVNENQKNVSHIEARFCQDFGAGLNFLKSYVGSLGTFNSYRREVERLLHWSWSIQNKTLPELTREDIETYVRFCQNPPESWIGLKKVPRFLEKEGLRIPNSQWRPFVVTIAKALRKMGRTPSTEQFNLSQGAIQEIFAILSTFFNFLIAEEYLPSNPVALIRQKSKFIRKRQQLAPIRRLSIEQWKQVLQITEDLASQQPEKHERTRFILSMLFGLYLRISELVANERWIPTMNDFRKDSNGYWWFTTVGKGNKERQIAVSDEVLLGLKRWRTYLGLPALPSPSDNACLIPKLKGHGPMSDTAPIRRLVQYCFDLATNHLRLKGKHEDADHLAAATVHWLRHTGISEDVKIRPREHVRDDAGHRTSATTDRYIDVELKARHESAKAKKITYEEPQG